MISEYLKENPYKSYKDMIIHIQNKREDLLFNYDEKTHELCKEIYENIIDKDVTRKCGIKLNVHGGFNTMADAYEILSWCSPLTSTPFKVLLADVKVCRKYGFIELGFVCPLTAII